MAFGKESENELSNKFKEAIDYFTAGRNEGNSYIAVEHYSTACQAFIQLETLAKTWNIREWQLIAVAFRFLSYHYAEVCFCNILGNIKNNKEKCSLEEKAALFEWLKSICTLKDIKISETSLDQVSKERFEYIQDNLDESTIASGYNAKKFMDLLLKENYRENIEEMNQSLQHSLFSREMDYNIRKKYFKKADVHRNALKNLEIIFFNKYGEFRGLKTRKGIEIYWDIDRIMMVFFEIYLNSSVELEIRKQLIAKASWYIEEFEKYEGEIGDLLQMLKELSTSENVIHYGLKKLDVSSWKFSLKNGLDTIETLEKVRATMMRDIKEGRAIPPYCKNCGSIIERGSSHCCTCGNQLEKNQIVEAQVSGRGEKPELLIQEDILPDKGPGARVLVGGRIYSIVKSSMTIGRGESADIRVADPDLLVSRMHARILRDDAGQYWVEDTNSTHGTFIYSNGHYKKIKKWALYNGDIIVLCHDPKEGKEYPITFETAEDRACITGLLYTPGVTELQAEIILEGRRIPLTKEVMTLGRSEDADIYIADQAHLVSRTHAKIYRDNTGQYWIEDTSSANGTFIYQNGNYKKIQKWALYSGDIIVLCHDHKGGKEFSLVFENIERERTQIY